MRRYLRTTPDKVFFYDQFSEDMHLSEGMDWGVDISSANLKNRWYFHTKKYLGIDLNHKVFANCTISPKHKNTYLTVSDIRQLCLKPKKIDLVVSTYTLHWLPEDQFLSSVKVLVDLVKPGGAFLLNAQFYNKKHEADVDLLLNNRFDTVRKLRYKKFFIADIYQNDYAKKIKREFSSKNKIRIACISFLAMLEYIPLLQKTGNTLYYFARNRRSQ